MVTITLSLNIIYVRKHTVPKTYAPLNVTKVNNDASGRSASLGSYTSVLENNLENVLENDLANVVQ